MGRGCEQSSKIDAMSFFAVRAICASSKLCHG